jgi:hypothetical protein
MPNDYDPAMPSYLYRAAQLLIHHRTVGSNIRARLKEFSTPFPGL